jgi:3-keto-5-aminohexanoate cleavage enzyme
MAPMMLMVAPNGARRAKAEHPALPITAAEIGSCAAACAAAGAAAIHVHARDAGGGHILDPVAFQEIFTAIRAGVGTRLILQATTEAVGRYTAAEQLAFARTLRPEAISFALREIVPDAAHERPAAETLAWLHRERVWIQYILYEPAELSRLVELHARGVIPDQRPSLLFVLGRYAQGQIADPADLLGFLHGLDRRDWPWSVCAFGPAEGSAVMLAAGLGGHARVGFENNLELADGTRAGDNAALVSQAVRIARLGRRSLLSADAARELLFP